MSLTETISRKAGAGAELGRKIRFEFSTGRATRPALEVERLLAICRNCELFAADHCRRIDLEPDGPDYHELLTRADLHCRIWLHRPEVPARSPISLSEPGLVDALARLHEQGPKRSQAERRAARRAAARRRSARRKR